MIRDDTLMDKVMVAELSNVQWGQIDCTDFFIYIWNEEPPMVRRFVVLAYPIASQDLGVQDFP